MNNDSPGESLSIRSHHARQHGFTLIGLLTVVVILSILASLAIAPYRDYIQRAHRTDAREALLRIAAAQERFYLNNHSYASNAELALPPPVGLGIDATSHGFYTLAIEPHPEGLREGYTASATAAEGMPTWVDEDCRTFFIDYMGTRWAENSAGETNSHSCAR